MSKPKYVSCLADLVSVIITLFPEAATFDPCPCGIICCVVPPQNVKPEIHFVVPDKRLRDLAREVIRARRLLFSAVEGDDAVLILAEVA